MVLLITLRRTLLLCEQWTDYISLSGGEDRSALYPLVKHWMKDVVPCEDIKLSGSPGRTLSDSLCLGRCCTACVKGNNYLLEFLRGIVQFRIIIQSLRIINTGIILRSIDMSAFCLVDYHWDKMHMRKCSSLLFFLHCHCKSRC